MELEMPLKRDDAGKWILEGQLRGATSGYTQAVKKYLNDLDPLFTKAKEKCEFEFIATLLRMDRMELVQCDTFKNLEEVFAVFTDFNKKAKNDKAITHAYLYLYGLIVEASELYEIMANLLNVVEGKRYLISNFPDFQDPIKPTRKRSQSPSDKISQLISRGKKQKIDLSFLNEVLDNKLRNAIFHSDYAIDWPKITIKNPLYQYEHKEWQDQLNKALAYYETLKNLYYLNITMYNSPKVIEVPEEFSGVKGETAITIIRDGYGLIGIRDNFSEEELKKGKIPFWFGRNHAYERKYIEKRKLVLPRDRVKIANRIIEKFPLFLRKYMIKLGNLYVNRYN